MSVAELRELDLSPRQRLVLHDVDWKTYYAVSLALDGRHLRLPYDGETLELMTIARIHSTLSRLLGRFVVVLTEEFQLPVASCGDMTVDREDLVRGLEGDETFYITNEPRVRGKEQLDFQIDPPPDLAIEIDITSSSRRRMAIFTALRVPEIWRYDGQMLDRIPLGTRGRVCLGFDEPLLSSCAPRADGRVSPRRKSRRRE